MEEKAPVPKCTLCENDAVRGWLFDHYIVDDEPAWFCETHWQLAPARKASLVRLVRTSGVKLNGHVMVFEPASTRYVGEVNEEQTDQCPTPDDVCALCGSPLGFHYQLSYLAGYPSNRFCHTCKDVPNKHELAKQKREPPVPAKSQPAVHYEIGILKLPPNQPIPKEYDGPNPYPCAPSMPVFEVKHTVKVDQPFTVHSMPEAPMSFKGIPFPTRPAKDIMEHSWPELTQRQTCNHCGCIRVTKTDGGVSYQSADGTVSSTVPVCGRSPQELHTFERVKQTLPPDVRETVEAMEAASERDRVRKQAENLPDSHTHTMKRRELKKAAHEGQGVLKHAEELIKELGLDLTPSKEEPILISMPKVVSLEGSTLELVEKTDPRHPDWSNLFPESDLVQKCRVLSMQLAEVADEIHKLEDKNQGLEENHLHWKMSNSNDHRRIEELELQKTRLLEMVSEDRAEIEELKRDLHEAEKSNEELALDLTLAKGELGDAQAQLLQLTGTDGLLVSLQLVTESRDRLHEETKALSQQLTVVTAERDMLKKACDVLNKAHTIIVEKVESLEQGCAARETEFQELENQCEGFKWKLGQTTTELEERRELMSKDAEVVKQAWQNKHDVDTYKTKFEIVQEEARRAHTGLAHAHRIDGLEQQVAQLKDQLAQAKRTNEILGGDVDRLTADVVRLEREKAELAMPFDDAVRVEVERLAGQETLVGSLNWPRKGT